MYVPGHMLPVGCASSSCQQYMSPLYFICIANKSFPGGSVVKESTCQCRRYRIHGFVSWVRKISWRRKWQPTPAFSPGKSHGQRRLAGYSPWGHKESDMTEHTHTHIHVIHFYQCGKIYKMGKLPPCHPEERPIICAGGELCFFPLLSGLQAQFPVGSYDFILASIINTDWCEELTHLKRPWCWERLRVEEKGMTEDEMVGWHHRLDGHGFGWAPRVGDGQGGLTCCGSWGPRESDMTEQLNWKTLNFFFLFL